MTQICFFVFIPAAGMCLAFMICVFMIQEGLFCNKSGINFHL